MNTFFPFIFNLADKRLLFVGGGSVAERKILLLAGKAKEIVVIAPAISEKLFEMTKEKVITCRNKFFEVADIDNSFDFVFACADDTAVNKSVIDVCKKTGVFVSAVDAVNRDCGDFFMPATIIEDKYLIAISSFGMSPEAAKKLKCRIKEVLTKDNI
jgi:siroheme synthase-like protein